MYSISCLCVGDGTNATEAQVAELPPRQQIAGFFSCYHFTSFLRLFSRASFPPHFVSRVFCSNVVDPIHFTKFLPRLFIGDAETSNEAFLAQHNIKCIIYASDRELVMDCAPQFKNIKNIFEDY